MRPRHPRSERPTRPRQGLLAAAVVLFVAVDCTGTLVEYTASPATIPDSAAEGQGYVHGNTTEVPVTYRVGAAGVTRNVTARTWISGCSKTTAEDDVVVALGVHDETMDETDAQAALVERIEHAG